MSIRGKLTALACAVACACSVTIPLVFEVTAEREAYVTTEKSETAAPPETSIPITSAEEETTPPDTSAPSAEDKKITVGVFLIDDDKVTQMTLEEYIICVVAAEMPYTFHTEALKAQAVAARTYCLYKLFHGSSHENGAEVCTDYSHCAAFISRDELLSRYGEQVTNSITAKISNAVKATEGQILVYNGEPILAAFHSRSYKRTESSLNVWGGYRPYLVSVPTPESDSISNVTLTNEQLNELFSSSSVVECVTAEKNKLISETNDSGRQSVLSYNGRSVKAKLLRSLFGFRSTAFEYKKTEDGYIFTVHGYGHGVGMSQYGANEMAKNGAGYEEILKHYYTGVSFSEVESLWGEG